MQQQQLECMQQPPQQQVCPAGMHHTIGPWERPSGAGVWPKRRWLGGPAAGGAAPDVVDLVVGRTAAADDLAQLQLDREQANADMILASLEATTAAAAGGPPDLWRTEVGTAVGRPQYADEFETARKAELCDWLEAPPDKGEYCGHCEHWGCACMWHMRGEGGAAVAGPFSARELRWFFLYGAAGGEGVRARCLPRTPCSALLRQGVALRASINGGGVVKHILDPGDEYWVRRPAGAAARVVDHSEVGRGLGGPWEMLVGHALAKVMPTRRTSKAGALACHRLAARARMNHADGRPRG
jgi:hypothetical protein